MFLDRRSWCAAQPPEPTGSTVVAAGPEARVRVRRAQPGTGTAGPPPLRYPPPQSPPTGTGRECTRRRRAAAPPQSGSRWELLATPRGDLTDRARAASHAGVRLANGPPEPPRRRRGPTPTPWLDGR